MPTYFVQVPVTGYVKTFVEADTADAAITVAVETSNAYLASETKSPAEFPGVEEWSINAQRSVVEGNFWLGEGSPKAIAKLDDEGLTDFEDDE